MAAPSSLQFTRCGHRLPSPQRRRGAGGERDTPLRNKLPELGFDGDLRMRAGIRLCTGELSQLVHCSKCNSSLTTSHLSLLV